MQENRELSPGEELYANFNRQARTLRGAIRWLMEAQRFKNMYASEDWQQGAGGELAVISKKVYDEAIQGVINSRQEFERARLKWVNHKESENE